MELEELKKIFYDNIKNKTLSKGIFSSLRDKKKECLIEKIRIIPLYLKETRVYQIEYVENNKAFHKNLDSNETIEYFQDKFYNFKNINIFTETKEYSAINNGNIKKIHLKVREIENKINVELHNREKNYIIREGEPVEFLIDLGIMDSSGKIIKSSYNKFKQINKYLEFIKDVIENLKKENQIDNSLKVVDFGSGKSYLTFVLYYYLKYILKIEHLEVIGLDLKKDVMEHCHELKIKYNFENLEFLHGDIKEFNKLKNADLVISLHACNNATDYGLIKGLELGAKAILAVPCCHNEFNSKITKTTTGSLKTDLSCLTKHGILMEKVTSLLTDGFRSDIMELCGYRSNIIEFIDTEHTPKNLLIKCIKIKESNFKKNLEKKKLELEKFMKYLGIEPILYSLSKKYFINFK